MLYPKLKERMEYLTEKFLSKDSLSTEEMQEQCELDCMYNPKWVKLQYLYLGKFPSRLKESKKLLEWITISGHVAHPAAIIASYLSSVTTMFTREVYTETKCSTPLYIVALAPTGTGKDIVTKVPIKILHCIRDKNRIEVTSKVSSLGALDDIYNECPIVSLIVDEFGDAFGTLLKTNNPVQIELREAIKALYSKTDGTYEPKRYSSSGGRNNLRPYWRQLRPSLSITGICTKAQLLDHLDDKFISDGFLNRFIFIDGSSTSEPFENMSNVALEVPEKIRNYIADTKLDLFNHLKSNHLDYKVIPLSSDAKDYYEKKIGASYKENTDIKNYCSEGDKETRTEISARWRENAIRLATAMSAYERDEEVHQDTLEWAYTFIKTANLAFYNTFEQEAGNSRWDELKRKGIHWFQEHANSGNWVSLTNLSRSARPFKGLKSSERTELLQELVQIGKLEHQINDKTNEYRLKV